MDVVKASLPTKFGLAEIYGVLDEDKEHSFLVFGDLHNKNNVLCRVHSSCITGDVFHSVKCDCGEQLDYAFNEISKQGGLLVYLNQEGRGIGLINKIKAYSLQDQGYDTVDANLNLDLPVDNRDYKVVKKIIEYLKITSISLMTNNPDKINQLEDLGINIEKRVSIIVEHNPNNEGYLKTKQERMNHFL